MTAGLACDASMVDRFGIELTDYDIAAVTPAQLNEIRDAVFRHRFVLLRNQHCTPAELEKFAGMMGRPIPHVLERFTVPGHRNLLRITNLYDGQGQPRGVHDGGNYWHSDMSYLANTGVLTCLHSIKTASVGGDTALLDCVMPTLRLKHADGRHYWNDVALDTLTVRHRFGNRETLRNDKAKTQQLADGERRALDSEVVHPLLRMHPHTGSAALYAVAATANAIDGLSVDASADLLDSLCAYLLDIGAAYTHAYRPGDILIWDNLTTLHTGTEIPPSDRADNCRLLHRFNVEYGADEAQIQPVPHSEVIRH